ncbi:transposase [Kitasatospora sp. GP82]|uniref:transposase n=1 Tax=Kitasatospora sp. GP82 TaxID=3035089 RepID=UPI0024738259|nr:transposase [Kitasatospora sp. GP82]
MGCVKAEHRGHDNTRKKQGKPHRKSLCRGSVQPALHSLVTGLRRDQDAVVAGLSSSWSSGQVEGQVTRIGLLKRKGYGRANLDLLRRRILLAS